MPAMEAFNESMSKVRTSVEWVFGDIVRSFKFMDFKKELENRVEPNWEDVSCLCLNPKCYHMHVWKSNI